MAHRVNSWFLSEKGRRFTFAAVCSTSIAIFSAYTLPHTWLMNKYKDIVHLYSTGIPVRVPDTVEQRFNTALNLLGIADVDKDRIKSFTVFGFDVYNIGTTYSKFGGLVGLPINFSFENIEDIDTSNIMVDNEPVDWSKTESQNLLNSLILSEKAQLFAMAREISIINSPKLILDTCYGTSIFIFMYGIGNYINRKFNLYNKPTSIRGAMYSMIAFFGYGVYAFLTDYTQNYFDKQIDLKLSEMNEIFAEGGREFYEKIVQRNIALRKLMGPFGERQYSALGNNNYFIRQKSLPVVVRRDFFVNKVPKIKDMEVN